MRLSTLFFLTLFLLSPPAFAGQTAEVEPFMKNVTRVVLVILIPEKYKYAVDCHGKEDECAKTDPAHGVTDFSETEFVQQLKEIYQHYPAPLRPENLEDVFSQVIKDNIMPYVEGNLKWLKTPLVVLKRSPRFEEINSPGTLTVIVKLEENDAFKPEIGVLSVRIYRVDVPALNAFDAAMNETAARIVPIPFGTSEADITWRLKIFSTQMTPISSPPIVLKMFEEGPAFE